MINIAIDGFSGAGKSSLTKALAKKLGFKVLDTGAIFRAMAFGFDEIGYTKINKTNVKKFVEDSQISVKFVDGKQHVYVGKKDVTEFIRTEKISLLSAQLCVFPEIRAKYLKIAQKFARENDCLMEGRDIATVVMPNADVKIFLAADEQIRAKRRFLELQEKGANTTLEEVLKNMRERDGLFDKGVTQLMPTRDSIVVDNTNLTFEETIDECLKVIEEKISTKKAINIAIDGYVCSGKSTIAKALAKEIGFKVFDTGALYRGVACAFDYMHYDESKISEQYVEKFAKQISIGVEFVDDLEHVFVNGIDYTAFLRTEHISELSAKLSPFVCIREKVLKLQRDFARKNNIVMEGRDIGSFVLPDAEFKFFCTADENVRAKRRFEQQRAMGNDVEFEDVLRELQERDFKDIHRDHGALKILKDSIIVDTTKSSLDQSVKFCLKHIRKKYPKI